MIRTEVKGPQRLATDMAALAQKIKSGRGPIHAAIGHRMALTRVPDALRTNPDGWPAPRTYPRVYRTGGQPLLDTRRLSSAIAYKASDRGVRIGTNVEYARILQKGGTIRPRRAKWLLLPLAPPLSITEVRTFPQGKAAIKARYPNSFWLTKGPDGPGVYRPVRGKAGIRSRKYGDRRMKNQITGTWQRSEHEGRTIERIAAGRQRVVIRRYNWLRWRPADIADCKRQILAWLTAKKLPPVPATGGNPLGRIGRRHA